MGVWVCAIMCVMKTIYKGTFDFADLRRQGCIYVDKTKYLHRIISRMNDRFLFFSRPRRFGKSMMLSTLKNIFQGHRELFEGLYIDTQTDYDWKTYPVLHLDMSEINVSSAEKFESSLYDNTRDALLNAGIENPESRSVASDLLGYGIQTLSKEGPVVVLVDEYDAPIGRTLNRPELAEAIRSVLADYYIKLKSKSPLMRFMLMTGVSKFTKLSVFSSLNSPTDITFDPEYAGMLGYTDEELDFYFGDIIAERAEKSPCDDYRGEIRRWFNGYRFTKAEVKVYNPVSIAQTLTATDYDVSAQWTGTGRPAMLAAFLETHDVTSLDFEKGISAYINELENSATLTALHPKAMLFQCGYLTIADYHAQTGLYTLGFPDEEIRRDMYLFLSDIRAKRDGWCQEALSNLESGNIGSFLRSLPALYASMTYNGKDGIPPESHYQNILHGVMMAGGFVCHAEIQQSSRKRSNLTVETVNYCYIFELKRGKTVKATSALKQITDRKYAAPYRGTGRQIIAVGLVFHPEDHTLRDSAWKML